MAAVAACLLIATANAQVVERHLPPAPVTEALAIGGETPQPDRDNRPIGVRLIGIALLSASEPVDAGRPGISIGTLASPGRHWLTAALSGYLDHQLSPRLIARIAATVAHDYRRRGRPFVSVTSPPQELTGGVLRLRVVPFAAERLTVRASTPQMAARVAARIRFASGAQIDAWALRQDLGWLDRYPFRLTSAVFASGAAPGTTDLTLTVVSHKPWQLYGGIATSDAPSSGNARYFVGGTVGGLIGVDSIVSAQATASGFGDPRYLSVAGRATAPIGPRREVTLLAGYVRGDTEAAPFASAARTAQVSLDLRIALPPAFAGDGRLGIEASRQRIEVRFGGERVYRTSATTLALVAGYNAAVAIPRGTVSADAALHVSPGGIGGGNRASRLFFARPGGGDATYTYATFDLAVTRAVARRLEWRSQLLLQLAGAAIPSVAQTAIGGSAYVRGYTFDDGGYDAAAVLRNDLRLRSYGSAKLSPNVFLDVGKGRYFGRASRSAAVSLGAGFEQRLPHGMTIRGESALPLMEGERTRKLQPRVTAVLTASL